MSIGFFAHPWLTADRMLQLVGLYIQIMRELRMKDGSANFSFTLTKSSTELA